MNPYSESQKPEFCPVKNTDTIVIFIHGIVEGPAQFKDLMKLTIQHGYSAVSLLLPGQILPVVAETSGSIIHVPK